MNAITKTSAVLGTAAMLVLGTTGCATKKYVRQTVSPVEARASTLEQKSSEHGSAIGELENNVSRVDEKATEAGRSAQAANQAADRANQAALEARNRADAAASASEQNASRIGTIANNIDNYQLVTTQAVLFPLNKAILTQDAKDQLDQAVAQIQNNKNYVLEIEGFTDKSGSRDLNMALAQRRADAVVRYLTVEHNVPLRRVHVLGVGADQYVADNKTRDGRKQNRRVELKVFALNLENGAQNPSAMNSQGSASQMSPSTSSDATTGRVTTGGTADSGTRARTTEQTRP